MAVQKGTTLIWSVDGITATGIVGSGIEQSFSRSVSSAQKEIMGDDGECKTLILHNAKADPVDDPHPFGFLHRGGLQLLCLGADPAR